MKLFEVKLRNYDEHYVSASSWDEAVRKAEEYAAKSGVLDDDGNLVKEKELKAMSVTLLSKIVE